MEGTIMKITKTNEFTRTKLNLIVFGNLGCGKRVFGSTVPDPLILDIEGGTMSIRHKRVDTVRIESCRELGEAFEFLKKGKHRYKSVVIDSGTELQRKIMEDVVAGTKHEYAQQRDWGITIERIRRCVWAFRDLPLNFVMTALAMESRDEGDGTSIVVPSFNGKTLPGEIVGFMDLCLYLFVGEKKENGQYERLLLTQPTQKFVAKDRSGKLDRLEKPNFMRLYRKIFSGRGEGTSKAA